MTQRIIGNNEVTYLSNPDNLFAIHPNNVGIVYGVLDYTFVIKINQVQYK